MNPDGISASFSPFKPCCVDAVKLEELLNGPYCDPPLDIVLVIDSSSSVKTENWKPQMDFVKKVVSIFNVGSDTTRVGAFRYNKLIDASTEIKLSDSVDLDTLLASLDAIPYDGSGTHTGKAIDYALTNHLSEAYGNRPDVQDFVVVITDGKSQDDVVTPSNNLRASGASVFAVGVGLKENGILTMNQIAGDPAFAFNVVGGFGALDKNVEAIQELLKVTVCHPCTVLKEPVPVEEIPEFPAMNEPAPPASESQEQDDADVSMSL